MDIIEQSIPLRYRIDVYDLIKNRKVESIATDDWKKYFPSQAHSPDTTRYMLLIYDEIDMIEVAKIMTDNYKLHFTI